MKRNFFGVSNCARSRRLLRASRSSWSRTSGCAISSSFDCGRRPRASHCDTALKFGTSSMIGNLRLSPSITALAKNRLSRSRPSIGCGATYFPPGRLDQVLLPVGDAQAAVGVDLADVAGVEPAVAIDRLGGRLGLVVVPLHHVRSARQDLAVRRRSAPRRPESAGRRCPA